MSRVFAAAVLCAASTAGCKSSSAETASVNSFCVSADEVFNKSTFASDGGGVVDSLRRLDVTDLVGADQQSISTAIAAVEAKIASFSNGQSPDGWSTEPVATVAARICGKSMQNFFVMP